MHIYKNCVSRSVIQAFFFTVLVYQSREVDIIKKSILCLEIEFTNRASFLYDNKMQNFEYLRAFLPY